MKTVLFIIALAFNLILCLYPMEQPLNDTVYEPAIENKNPGISVDIAEEEDEHTLSYSQFLKSKANQLTEQASN